jgi:hypothetical protein
MREVEALRGKWGWGWGNQRQGVMRQKTNRCFSWRRMIQALLAGRRLGEQMKSMHRQAQMRTWWYQLCFVVPVAVTSSYGAATPAIARIHFRSNLYVQKNTTENDAVNCLYLYGMVWSPIIRWKFSVHKREDYFWPRLVPCKYQVKLSYWNCYSKCTVILKYIVVKSGSVQNTTWNNFPFHVQYTSAHDGQSNKPKHVVYREFTTFLRLVSFWM